MTQRVVIVDDDELWRERMAASLANSDELIVARSATHDVAVDWSEEWEGVDVAIVDAGDIRRQDDHFPGVGVVRKIRRCRGNGVLIIVITGHYLDDALRWRMSEADADFFYHRSDVEERSSLVEAILHPERARHGVPDVEDPETAFRVGVVRGSRLNAAVDFLNEHNLHDDAGRKCSPRSRRWLRMRAEFNRVARLNPVNIDGTIPERDQASPSYDQIDRFARWATRAKGDGPDKNIRRK